MDWSAFTVDEQMLKDIADLEAGKSVKGDYPEVPVGKYEVVPEKFEMKMSKNGNPMMVVWLRVVAGQFKKSMIFANFVMKSAFGIHNAKQFLKQLDEEANITFTSFEQFEVMLAGVQEELAGKVSYVLNYGEDKNGYKTYKVEDGPFEVPNDYEPPKASGWSTNE